MIKTKIILIWFLFGISLFGCEKDDSENCGCDSTVTFNYTELIGNISYKKQLDPKDNFYVEKYWIGYTEPNCTNCMYSLIVCNEDLLTDFKELVDSSPQQSVAIKFSGNTRKLCKEMFAPSDYTYNHITLTKIDKL